MQQESFLETRAALLPRLIEVLSLADCLHRLGCGDEEAGELLSEWLEHEDSRVVGRVSREARAPLPSLAAAA
jgi:hypothetical protein